MSLEAPAVDEIPTLSKIESALPLLMGHALEILCATMNTANMWLTLRQPMHSQQGQS